MTTLSSARLTKLLTAALPGATLEPSHSVPKPARLQVPKLGEIQCYLWTTTPDKSQQGRPAGEHKSQIIIPGTPKGSKQHLDLEVAPTFLLGFSPLFGVFVGWQAALHQDAGYSNNLQVQENLLAEASRVGWAVDEPRRTGKGPEVRVAVHPSLLKRYFKSSIEADSRELSGEQRAFFLMAQAPEFDRLDIRDKADAGEPLSLEEIQRERVIATGTRLKREAGFAKKVLAEFDQQCAVCSVQLGILDAAHIVPVHHPKGSDEVWNGLALCKNHHWLFDKRIMLIDGNGVVRVDPDTRKVLKSLGQLGGYKASVGIYRNKPLKRLPNYFSGGGKRVSQLKAALALNFAFS